MNLPGLNGGQEGSGCEVLRVEGSWHTFTTVVYGSLTTSWQLSPTSKSRFINCSTSILEFCDWHSWYWCVHCTGKHCVFDNRVLSNWEEILAVPGDVCGKVLAILPISKLKNAYPSSVVNTKCNSTLCWESKFFWFGSSWNNGDFLLSLPAYCVVGKTLLSPFVGKGNWFIWPWKFAQKGLPPSSSSNFLVVSPLASAAMCCENDASLFTCWAVRRLEGWIRQAGCKPISLLQGLLCNTCVTKKSYKNVIISVLSNADVITRVCIVHGPHGSCQYRGCLCARAYS